MFNAGFNTGISLFAPVINAKLVTWGIPYTMSYELLKYKQYARTEHSCKDPADSREYGCRILS